jgi:FixJ family two-component response regulator
LTVVGQRSLGFGSATAFLKADLQHVACLLLDHHMPGMTGLELTERLRADGVTIPILLITGRPNPTIIAHAARLGIAKVLEKPPDEDEVLAFVSAAGK